MQYEGDDVTWPVPSFITFDPDNISKIPLNSWLKPVKWNQEGFDMACVVQEEAEGRIYLRYVQVTNGQTHKANIQYLSKFASKIADVLNIPEGLGIEFVVVYPIRAIPPTITIVPSSGHLSHFNVGKSMDKWTRGDEVNHIQFLTFESRNQ